MKKILTIAASDSGGGAGIQADIKAITVLGGFAMSAVTAITAQNTRTVEAVHPVPQECIRQQIQAVLSDIGADAVKTGMLLNAETIQTVSALLRQYRCERVVVDPVMVATSGSRLLEQAAVDTLRQELFPLACMITPNLAEASALCGRAVDTPAAMREAARALFSLGPRHILIKGGHLQGDCVDLFYDGRDFTELASPRIDTKNTHGTGCTLSAAIAAGLAKGSSPLEAAQRAKEFITTAIRFSLPLGSGHGPTNPYACLERDVQIAQCAAELERAFHVLQQGAVGKLIPEIQSNLGYAPAAAAAPGDVVAFPGRIIRLGDSITKVALPAAGASRHIAKIILTAMRRAGTVRSAMNLAWSPDIIECCRALGLTVGEFDRAQEPPGIKAREGATLEWGTQHVIDRLGKVPDIIFDRGDTGKEPVTRVLGTDPMDVARRVLNIAKEMERRC